MNEVLKRSRAVRIADALLIVGGVALLVLFTTRYLMAFRLDDVLHMEWARSHSFFGAWDPVHGSIVRSFRPIFAATIWLLTHTAGTSNYLPWHITLVGSFLIGLAFAGRTARYIAQSNSALYFTVLLYWIAFLPILNVLFWYGDLTYTLELMFVTPAWYYGLRGILEGNVRRLSAGLLCGVLAVMTKEPAIVLVHSVLVGAVIFRWREVREVWRRKQKSERTLAIVFYLLFIGITLFILFASDTRSNRFFDLHTPFALFKSDMLERERYYDSILLRLLPRLLLFTPIFYASFVSIPATERLGKWKFLVVFGFALLLAFSATELHLAAALLLLSLLVGVILSRDKRAIQLLLPLAGSAVITMSVLLITIMIVKTQLTELAIVLLVLSGWGWSRVLRDIAPFFAPYLITPFRKGMLIGMTMIIAIVGTIGLLPGVLRQESLLGNVRDVRNNVNNAIKWSALHLPKGATLAMPGYHLYGLGRMDDLSQTNDSTKIGSQYVFHDGYVYIYLNLLGRGDIVSYPLEDTIRLLSQLDTLRKSQSYLFLQSELDHQKFDAPASGLLSIRDSLLASFNFGGFHSEIWQLRN